MIIPSRSIRRTTRHLWVLSILLPCSVTFSIFSQSDTPQVSYAVITSDPGQTAPVGTALFRLEDSQGVLLSEAAVGAVRPIRSGRIFVDQVGSQTGFAVANLSSATATLDLVLRDADGLQVDRRTDRKLEAGRQIAIFVDQLFSVADAFTGSLTFSTLEEEAELAAVTVRQGLNSQGQIFATLPVVDLSATMTPAGILPDSRVFPHIGAGDSLSTQLILINYAPRAASGTVELTASDGTPLEVEIGGEPVSEFDFVLLANGTLRVTLERSEGVVQGYAVVRADGGSPLPSGTAIFQFRDSDGIVSEAGVGAIAATRKAQILVDNVGTQTGVAIANPANEEGQIQFTLLDRNGQHLGEQTRAIPAGGHMAIFADQLFSGLPATFTGVLQLSSTIEVFPVTLKLTTNSRGALILTTLPLATEADLIPFPLVFPQIGFGGVFSTRLLFLNPSDQALTGSLQFFRPDSTPLPVALTGVLDPVVRYQVLTRGARQFRPGNTALATGILINPFSPTPDEVVVNLDQSLQLSPIVIDDRGQPRDDFPLSYTAVSPEIASVSEEGSVTGLERGFSTLTLSTGGVVSAGTITVAEVTGGVEGFEVQGLQQDLAGRLYLGSAGSHTILRAQSLSQPPTLYAGQNESPGFVDDLRLDARFRGPGFMAYNQIDGSLFVSDSENHSIRRVGPGAGGRVQTLAGSSTPGSADGSLDQARFNRPLGVALDAAGQLWVADSGNHTVRRIDLAAGKVSTIAGEAGVPGSADGAQDAARFHAPAGIAIEIEPLAQKLERERRGAAPPPVSVLVVDSGSGRIRRVNQLGQVETLREPSSGELVPSGESPPLLLSEPLGIATDPFGRIYVTEPGLDRVTAILGDGRRIPVAQPGTFADPRAVSITSSGRVLVAAGTLSAQQIRFGEPEFEDFENEMEGEENRVLVRGRNFSTDSTVVLSGTSVNDLEILDSTRLRFSLQPTVEIPENGLLTGLTLHNQGGSFQVTVTVKPDRSLANRGFFSTLFPPRDVSLDGLGNIYLSDDFGEINLVPAGTSIPVAIARDSGLISAAGSVVDAAGNLYVTDPIQHRVLRIDRLTLEVTILAGTGTPGFGGDGGAGPAALLDSPIGVELGPDGAIYFSDTGNHRVRRIDPETGTISTVAGNGTAGSGGDGGPALLASLSGPRRLDFDPEGNLLITDTGNHRIRRLNLDATLVGIAGAGTAGFSGDSGPAALAELSSPEGVAVDFDGNIFIADTDNNRIRRISASDGSINTVAGSGAGFPSDGVPALDFPLLAPTDVFVDAAGNLYVVDGLNFGGLHKVDAITQILTTLLDGFDAERSR